MLGTDPAGPQDCPQGAARAAGRGSGGPPGPAQDSWVVGRDEHCDLQLPDQHVSRRHARFSSHPQGWVLEDLGSLNGTYLNGQPVTGPLIARPGDDVRFAAAVYRVGAAQPLEQRVPNGR